MWRGFEIQLTVKTIYAAAVLNALGLAVSMLSIEHKTNFRLLKCNRKSVLYIETTPRKAHQHTPFPQARTYSIFRIG